MYVCMYVCLYVYTYARRTGMKLVCHHEIMVVCFEQSASKTFYAHMCPHKKELDIQKTLLWRANNIEQDSGRIKCGKAFVQVCVSEWTVLCLVKCCL